MNDRRLAILLLAMGIGAAACSSSPAPGAHDSTGIPVASPTPPAMTLFDRAYLTTARDTLVLIQDASEETAFGFIRALP